LYALRRKYLYYKTCQERRYCQSSKKSALKNKTLFIRQLAGPFYKRGI